MARSSDVSVSRGASTITACSVSATIPIEPVWSGAFFSDLSGRAPLVDLVGLVGLVRLVGLVSLVRFLGLVGDDAVDLARAAGRALADRGRGLAADLAGRRLALAELAHVGDSRGRSLHRLGGADLRQLVIQASCPGAGAPAPARARTSNAAGTTSRDQLSVFARPFLVAAPSRRTTSTTNDL